MATTKKKVCPDCGCEKEEGKDWEISDYELQYFRDHLPLKLRKQFDAIEKTQGRAAAFGYTVQQVLRESMPDLTVHLPDKNVSILPLRTPLKRRGPHVK
jgi:hypothetical protein